MKIRTIKDKIFKPFDIVITFQDEDEALDIFNFLDGFREEFESIAVPFNTKQFVEGIKDLIVENIGHK